MRRINISRRHQEISWNRKEKLRCGQCYRHHWRAFSFRKYSGTYFSRGYDPHLNKYCKIHGYKDLWHYGFDCHLDHEYRGL